MDISAEISFCRVALAGLSVFAELKTRPLLSTFGNLLEAAEEAALAEIAAASLKRKPKQSPLPAFDAVSLCGAWAAFASAVMRHDSSLTHDTGASFFRLTAELTLNSDNVFTRAAEKSATAEIPPQSIPFAPVLKAAAAADLDRLQCIASYDIPALGFYLASLLANRGFEDAARRIEAEARAFWASEGAENAAASFFPKDAAWSALLPEFAAHIGRCGAGELGQYWFFSWSENALRPVANPDPVTLADLCGYEDQRSVVAANTLRFAEGQSANNILLYGDRGTGKSATVKAVCREYAEQGLRLIEVRKSDLFDLPRILDTLAARSLRFVVFIDDLSFEVIDDSFTALKALLEGGVETRPPNVVIYATSNRRHLVKERLADRPTLAQTAADSGGEVRAFESVQELFSLADRFGLSLLYTAPSQEEYLAIAEFIARKRNVIAANADDAQLQQFRGNALRWEKWFNGRSPRTALQYATWAAGGADWPWE